MSTSSCGRFTNPTDLHVPGVIDDLMGQFLRVLDIIPAITRLLEPVVEVVSPPSSHRPLPLKLANDASPVHVAVGGHAGGGRRGHQKTEPDHERLHHPPGVAPQVEAQGGAVERSDVNLRDNLTES